MGKSSFKNGWLGAYSGVLFCFRHPLMFGASLALLVLDFAAVAALPIAAPLWAMLAIAGVLNLGELSRVEARRRASGISSMPWRQFFALFEAAAPSRLAIHLLLSIAGLGALGAASSAMALDPSLADAAQGARVISPGILAWTLALPLLCCWWIGWSAAPAGGGFKSSLSYALKAAAPARLAGYAIFWFLALAAIDAALIYGLMAASGDADRSLMRSIGALASVATFTAALPAMCLGAGLFWERPESGA